MSNIKTYDSEKYIIKIDLNLCIGCGTCAALASRTFAINEKTFKAEVKPAPHDNPKTILTAAQACPVSGIILINKTTQKQIWPKK